MLKQEQYRLRDAVRRVASPARRATGRRQASRMSFEDEMRMLQDTEGTPHGGRALGRGWLRSNRPLHRAARVQEPHGRHQYEETAKYQREAALVVRRSRQ